MILLEDFCSFYFLLKIHFLSHSTSWLWSLLTLLLPVPLHPVSHLSPFLSFIGKQTGFSGIIITSKYTVIRQPKILWHRYLTRQTNRRKLFFSLLVQLVSRNHWVFFYYIIYYFPRIFLKTWWNLSIRNV